MMEFKKGFLYVQIINSVIKDLFYPDEEVPPDYSLFRSQEIAIIRRGKAIPYIGGSYETAYHGEISVAGHLIEFRRAGDDDILKFLSSWTKGDGFSTSIAKWIENIRKDCKNLSEEEKERIARLAEGFI